MAQLLRNPVYSEKDEEYNCAMSESVGEVKVMTDDQTNRTRRTYKES
jgi:hypothetical protein